MINHLISLRWYIYNKFFHWKGNVIFMKFPSLNALEVVILTTSNATRDDNFVETTIFPIQRLSSYRISRLTRHCTFLDFIGMMTSSNGNIFRVTGPLCGEFTGPGEFPTQSPVTRSFDVFFDLRLNKRLSKQPWGWWFETPSWSLWRHFIGLWTHPIHQFVAYCSE